jgi:uncharacterized integral membrane protein (TIGR00698 family)
VPPIDDHRVGAPDRRVEPDGPAPDAPARAGRALTWTRRITPGLAAAVAITVVATWLGHLAPVVGAPVFAIAIGIVVALVRPPGDAFAPGIRFTSKKVLQGSIIMLGFGLSLSQVIHTGVESLPVLLGSLAVVGVLAWLVGRWLGIRRDANLLIGVGTAICGASAIAATNAVIDADDADVSYAIATIFLFNVIAVLSYPSIGHALGLSQHSFGLWAGTAINDTSSVVAASDIYGHAAVTFAVVVKLTRTLAIVPICVAVAWWWNRHPTPTTGPAPDAPDGDAHPDEPGRVPLRQIFPVFILAFIAAVLVNSVGIVPDAWHHDLADLATWMITAALAAIGLSTRFRDIRTAGLRPILLGGILWAGIGLGSLGLQAATGTL